MAKKNKLNSNNPRYKKVEKTKEKKVEKKLVQVVKGVKIYTINNLT
ncbi:MAG: hypothetical protein Tp152SUR359831_9 [Prokaryotic dsDNA virus sp.]|nr:MAG: hypothetical protein Tp152SUR359831_9 [Prokaryotic dsDNA virus sp.]